MDQNVKQTHSKKVKIDQTGIHNVAMGPLLRHAYIMNHFVTPHFNREEVGVDVKEVKQRYADELMALPNVTGVGVGERDGAQVVKVFVMRKVPLSTLSAEERVPDTLEGVPCDVEEIGVISAQPTDQEGTPS